MIGSLCLTCKTCRLEDAPTSSLEIQIDGEFLEKAGETVIEQSEVPCRVLLINAHNAGAHATDVVDELESD